MRVHLLGQPNSQTTAAYVRDGFTQLTIRFSHVLKRLGIYTILYASEENEASCDELVTIISKDEQELANMGRPYWQADGRRKPNPWDLGNQRMIDAINVRKQPGDIICSIGGQAQKPVSDAFPDLPTVEFSIGYPWSYAPYRVFESRAWQHCVYGMEPITTGRPMDAVIHGFVDDPGFSIRKLPGDYLLYVGRLTARKGVSMACDMAKAAKMPLFVIGFGDEKLITYGGLIHNVTKGSRNAYMSQARAVLCPTQFIEPFNMVAVEAQIYGTPVISTDWGGFTETVEHGRTGYRVHTMNEAVKACQDVAYLDRAYIANRALGMFGMDIATEQYRIYFERLSKHLASSVPVCDTLGGE